MMETDSDSSLLHEMFQKTLKDPQDEFAVSMFSIMIKNDLTLVQKAIKLILEKVKSNSAPQSLRALELLEECMDKSGPDFQTEISKYRFLNELSKLVSIKHMGNETLKEIKDKIMDCFLLWTAQYPEKEKIKSVYDCLKKEGVHDTSTSNMSINCADQRKTDFVDEENEKKLKRLLQSTNKEDVKKANLLIQYLVKQDEKKRERVLKQRAQLKEVQTTVQLFNQVIDNYIEEKPEDDDFSLLEELYDSCTKHKHIVSKMPHIMEDSEEELIRDTIRVNDILLEVIEKYNNIQHITHGKTTKTTDQILNVAASTTKSLSDQQLDDLLSGPFDQPKIGKLISKEENPLNELAEIFAPNLKLDCLTPAPVIKQQNSENKLFEPITTSFQEKSFLETIDDLSADLFNRSLSNSQRIKTFTKENSKLSLNELSKSKIDSDIKEPEKTISLSNSDKENSSNKVDATDKEIVNICLPSTNENLLPLEIEKKCESNSKPAFTDIKIKSKINYLSEIEINFDEIKPSDEKQIVLLDSKDGLRVTLDFAVNKPLDHTSVIVVSSTNQSHLPIDDFLFDAFVHKPCKLRLLQRNGNFLPGVKPFRPPSDCLHQIMLVFNPTEKPLKVTFTFSYKQGDDPDPIKGSIVSTIPYSK